VIVDLVMHDRKQDEKLPDVTMYLIAARMVSNIDTAQS